MTGLMLCRNEDWILGLSARAALLWCYRLVILLHACEDDSKAIVQELQREQPGRIELIEIADPKWDEMKHRQIMLDCGRLAGASTFAMIDADEVLTANIASPRFARHIENTASPSKIVALPGYNLRDGFRYHLNGVWGQRWFSLAFQDRPGIGWQGDTFHSREPKPWFGGTERMYRQGDGGILHFWGFSERRLRAKHRAYKILEALRWPAKPVAEIENMYSLALRGSGVHDNPSTWRFAEVPAAWRYPEWERKYLHPDTVPWQEAWCERMIAEHGAARFAGLDLS